MEIDKPALNDIPIILKFWQITSVFHHGLDPEYYVLRPKERDEKSRQYLQEAITKDNPNILVAKDKGQIIGFITFEEGKADYSDTNIKKYGEVIELFVSEETRGKGVGKILMQAAEDFFRNKGLHFLKLQCSTYNKTALQFYRHIGYDNKQSLLYKKL